MKPRIIALAAALGVILTARAEPVVTTGPSVYPATDYQEPGRNQFHFSPKKGWMNDVNGVWYSDGLYHLTYQHHPVSRDWKNMHWGYATSPDMLHWTQHNPAIIPGENSVGMAYSGTATLDNGNTSGLKSGAEDLIILAFTDTGAGQSFVYSTDNGATWIPWENNPVIPPDPSDDKIMERRDPKVFWYAPGKHWVMVIFKEKVGMEFFTSPDLKTWKRESVFTGNRFWECPDLFEMTVEGSDTRKWVFHAATGHYYIGVFDGTKFTPESDGEDMAHGPDFYAGQTVANMPDGRTVQLAWLGMWKRDVYQDTVWNHGVTIPVDLKLIKTPEGLRLTRNPIPELATLRTSSRTWTLRTLKPGEDPLKEVQSQTFDLSATFDVSAATGETISFTFAGRTLTYDLKRRQLDGHPLEPIDGKIDIRMLRDRAALEYYANGGRLSAHEEVAFPSGNRSLSLTVDGEVALLAMEFHELRSVWNQPGQRQEAGR